MLELSLCLYDVFEIRLQIGRIKCSLFAFFLLCEVIGIIMNDGPLQENLFRCNKKVCGYLHTKPLPSFSAGSGNCGGLRSFFDSGHSQSGGTRRIVPFRAGFGDFKCSGIEHLSLRVQDPGTPRSSSPLAQRAFWDRRAPHVVASRVLNFTAFLFSG